jgi:hypothetical protein
MRVIVAGGRNFHNYQLLKYKLRKIFDGRKPSEIEIVSGGAEGADKLGEQFAKEHGCPVRRFDADWEKYGKSAGYIRNEEMAEYATHCVCFWDKRSKGTGHMIEIARRHGLPTRIITF